VRCNCHPSQPLFSFFFFFLCRVCVCVFSFLCFSFVRSQDAAAAAISGSLTGKRPLRAALAIAVARRQAEEEAARKAAAAKPLPSVQYQGVRPKPFNGVASQKPPPPMSHVTRFPFDKAFARARTLIPLNLQLLEHRLHPVE
jgi:hypothetical protein